MTGGMTPFSGRSGTAYPNTDTGWQAWTSGVPSGWTVRVRILGPSVWVNVNSTASVGTGSTTIGTGLPPSGAISAWSGARVGNSAGLMLVNTTGDLVVSNPTGSTQTNFNALYSYPLEP